ncbi:hypothetical protein EVAR_93684_1 [Eumeta japonica]|uniref:Uncharacterized protein n=1 Tax=Eumeta variegata TaxID=151549 RepID=A0A4C1TQR3_EUMVA|nr:hypothetical protein EVAR_93684_1 [Eumeta japonica]
MSFTTTKPHGACYAQFSDRTFRFEPKLPCIRATSVPDSAHHSPDVRHRRPGPLIIPPGHRTYAREVTERPTPPQRTTQNTSSQKLESDSLRELDLHEMNSRMGIITIWIRRGRIPDEKTSGHEATNKSSVPHLYPQKKCGRSANECPYVKSVYHFGPHRKKSVFRAGFGRDPKCGLTQRGKSRHYT